MYVEKCVKCKKLPRVVNVGDLFYVQCGCQKWEKYQFLGVRADYALEVWNEYNRPIKRGRQKDENDNI